MADMSRPILVTGAAGFAGSHLLDRLDRARRSAAEQARPLRPEQARPLRPEQARPLRARRRQPVRPTSSRGIGLAATHRPARARDGMRSMCWTLPPSAARSPSCGRASSTTAPARRTSDARGTKSNRRWPPTCAARTTCSMRSGAPDVEARVVIPSSALVYAGGDAALDEDAPLVPTSPYGLSKLAQELTGSTPSAAASTSRSRARSTTSARGRIRGSPRRASRGGSPTSKRDDGSRKSPSAISTPAATSPTCATPSARTS